MLQNTFIKLYIFKNIFNAFFVFRKLAELLDELDYAIQVIEKLEKEGISNALTEDFTKLKT